MGKMGLLCFQREEKHIHFHLLLREASDYSTADSNSQKAKPRRSQVPITPIKLSGMRYVAELWLCENFLSADCPGLF